MKWQWPWVSRKYLKLAGENFLALQSKNAEYILRLEHEISFYHEKFEKEQERADRAVDALVVAMGREPISEVSNKTHESYTKAINEMQEQLSEVYGDVAKSIIGEDDEDKVLEPEPPTSEERLEVLKKISRYNKPAAKDSSVAPSFSDTIAK